MEALDHKKFLILIKTIPLITDLIKNTFKKRINNLKP